MSTWHQGRAHCIAPNDKWTIVTNPPYGMRTFWVCDTESEARKRLDTWRMNGHGHHCTIVPPSSGMGIIL